jgi:hypothetical protein
MVAESMMGLSKRIGKSHAVLDLGDFENEKACFETKIFRFLLKDIKRCYLRANIVHKESHRRSYLGWSHFKVIYDHEKRFFSNWLVALWVSLFRFHMFHLQFSPDFDLCLDEYYAETGDLVAFSSSICKGRCLRVFWFYQSTAFCKCCIFHKQIELSLKRAFALHQVSYIDVGPATSKLKEKLGFVQTREYRNFYDGPYQVKICK